jgi:hypothetical protein
MTGPRACGYRGNQSIWWLRTTGKLLEEAQPSEGKKIKLRLVRQPYSRYLPMQ